MTSVYPKGVEETPVDPGRPPLMVRRGIEKIKAEVDIVTVAQGYGQFRSVGSARWKGRCLAPDHEDKTPSMSVKVDTQTFRCFGCGAYGDVIDLVKLVEGGETWEAMVALSVRYGVELPRRPQRWHEWSMEKDRRYDEIRAVRTRLYQRRLLRMFAADLALIEEPKDREEEARKLYEDLYGLARGCAIAREGTPRG